MKMKKMIISLIVIMTFLLTSTQLESLAAVTLNTDITSNNIIDQFNPSADTNDTQSWADPITDFIAGNIATRALSFIQIIGGILTILSIALYGLFSVIKIDPKLAEDLFGGKLLGRESPEFKKDLHDFLRRVIIGSILLFAGGTIVKAIMGLLLK